MSGDAEQEYFADGMVEEITTALSRFKSLFVIARNSTFTYKGRSVDIKQVGRELGVRYVLEGSVRKSGNRVRITGQLVETATGAHLWADRFDGAVEDVFELQDQVAASVAGAIAPSVTGAEIDRAKRKPTNSLDAYDYFLRGQAAHWQITKEGTDQAIAFYEQAIALDLEFAPAYAALAAAFHLRKSSGWSTDPAADISRSIACANGALRLGTQDPSVMARIALVLHSAAGEVERSDSLLAEAIRLNPNAMEAWLWRGWSKVYLGDHQAGMECFQRAIRLSPMDPRIFMAQAGLACAYFFLGTYEEGLKYATEALRDHPDYLTGLRVAIACNALSGNRGAAQEYWRRLALLVPSERVSDLRRRAAYRREQDFKKLEGAYRIAGMPE